jgi:hypothetical protein
MSKRIIGLARETTYGTYVAPAVIIPGTVNDGFSQEFIRDETPYGGRIMPTADVGRSNIRVSISNTDVRADYLGWILQAYAGAPVTTGSGPYTHVFKRQADDAAVGQALTGFTVHVEVGATRYAYTGCLLDSFTLEADAEGRVKISSMEFMARSFVDAPAATAVTPSTVPCYTFRHAQHKRIAAAYNLIQSLSVAFKNNISTLNLQDGTSNLGVSSLGRHEVTVSMTVSGTDTQLLTDWNNGNPNAVDWTFEWQISASNRLAVNLPRLKFSRPKQDLGGFDIPTKTVEGVAEYDTTAASESVITLINSVASYA